MTPHDPLLPPHLTPAVGVCVGLGVTPLSPQSFLYLTWYMAMSLLGHYNNFFFAAHLLDIAMGVKTLRTILSSVTHNGKQVGGRGGAVGGPGGGAMGRGCRGPSHHPGGGGGGSRPIGDPQLTLVKVPRSRNGTVGAVG